MLDSFLLQLSKKTGLSYSQKHSVVYGYYKNFCLSIQTFHNVAYVIFPLRLTEIYNFSDVECFLNTIRNDFSEIESISYKNFYLSIKYNCINANTNVNINNLLSLLNAIITESNNNRLYSCCPDCGRTTDIDPFVINKGVLLRCYNCISKIKDKIASSPRKNNRNETVFKPVIASFIGSLIGVALWITISLFGIYGAICGILITLFSIKAFQIFDGELNKSGLLITATISALMVFFASYISIGFVFYNKIRATGVSDAIENIPYWLSYPAIKKVFFQELLIGYLFFALGVISQVKTTYNLVKRKVLVEQLP